MTRRTLVGVVVLLLVTMAPASAQIAVISQRTPWQDARFTLDQAASRLIATVN